MQASGTRARAGLVSRLASELLVAIWILPLALAGAAEPLRVGTSGDYAPFSVVGPDRVVAGFDIAVAQAYAADRGRSLEIVPFRWPGLLDDLAAHRFDVAMSGITIRPERSAAGRFTVPVAESGAVVLLRERGAVRAIADLDDPAVRVAVNAGGHLERVTRRLFPRASVVAVPDNAAVRAFLHDDRVDAVITDTTEAPAWLRQAPGWSAHGPLTRDRKAYLVAADEPALAHDLDAWLLERERDGTLGRLRRRHLPSTTAVATPLGALLAAVDERLSLMPLVGATKRAAGLPLTIPERETVVLDAAVASVGAAAARAGAAPPPTAAVRGFFAAQIAAGKEVQMATAAAPLAPAPLTAAALGTVLRPALMRIGDRIAELVMVLPPDLDPDAVRAAVDAALRAPGLSDGSREEIAMAVVRLTVCARP